MDRPRNRTKTISIYKSGKSLVIRLPKRMVEDMGLQPGQHLLISWNRKEARLRKVEVE